MLFAYCGLHIHSESTPSYNYYRRCVYTAPLPDPRPPPYHLADYPIRSGLNSIEGEGERGRESTRIHEKVKCNRLTGNPKAPIARFRCVMRDNFVIVVSQRYKVNRYYLLEPTGRCSTVDFVRVICTADAE